MLIELVLIVLIYFHDPSNHRPPTILQSTARVLASLPLTSDQL